MTEDLIRLRFDNNCRSWIYQERDVSRVDYIEGYVADKLVFSLPIQSPDESEGALITRASHKMIEVLSAHMLEQVRRLMSLDYTPPEARLILCDLLAFSRRQQARIQAILAKDNPKYIQYLHHVAKEYVLPKNRALRMAALHELSWYYWPSPEGTGDAAQYNAIHRLIRDLEDAAAV